MIIFIVLLIISCRWMRNKRQRGAGRSRSVNDSNGKEMVPLNSTRPDLSEFKRGSKMSNLEATNQVIFLDLFFPLYETIGLIPRVHEIGSPYVAPSACIVYAERKRSNLYSVE